MRAGVRVVAVAAAALALAAGCADFSAPEDPTFGLPDVVLADPSFSRDIQPILTKRCVVGGCHTLGIAQGGLALDSTVAYAALVGVPSVSGGAYLRVAPGNAADSWLIRRLSADATERQGLPRMPLAATPLTANQLATVVAWIDRGARP